MILVKWNNKYHLENDKTPHLIENRRLFNTMKQVSAFIRSLKRHDLVGHPVIEDA